MNDRDCVAFLQWSLPRLGMRWPGFRRVRGQVCKRIGRRLRGLALDGIDAYRAHLDAHPGEWAVLDGLTRVTVSRFYRDRQVYERLGHEILPERAHAAAAAGRDAITVCSLGCGSGEEPFSVALLWSVRVQRRFPGIAMRIRALDADPHLLERARTACYPAGTLRELPPDLRAAGFREAGDRCCLRAPWARSVAFERHDIRDGVPPGPWDVVLCRNLAFTYFGEALQARIARAAHEALRPGGWLVTGMRERLPAGSGLERGARGSACHRRPVTP